MADSVFKGIWNSVSGYWEVEKLCADLALLVVRDDATEDAALDALDTIGETILNLPLPTQKYYQLLENIHQNGQTDTLRYRALEWIVELGCVHPNMSALVIERTKDLLSSKKADPETRALVAQGLGEIGTRFSSQLGYYTLSCFLGYWEDPDQSVRTEKFNQAEKILSTLQWEQIKNPKAVLQKIVENISAEREKGDDGYHAQSFYDLFHKKQLEGLKKQSDNRRQP